MRTLSLLAMMSVLSSPAIAQATPAGAQATGCAVSAFEPVRSDRTGEMPYWTNATCNRPRSGFGNGIVMGGGVMGDSMMSDR